MYQGAAAGQDAELTLLEVAARLGTYATCVSKCESGERLVEVVELAGFCDLDGVKLVDLLRAAGLA